MLKLVLATVLAAVVVGLPAKDGACKDSAANFCMPVKSCNEGYIFKDPSTCCDVCVKSRERSVCGGIANMFGKCDVGLICKVRHPFSIENKVLPAEAKIGKCEPAACKDVKCGMHQWCTVENNVPKCGCFINCNDKKESPVCTLKDGKNYKNRCMVRKLECKLQKQIGYLPGTCKKCLFNDNMYKFGEAVKGGEQCEKCTCRHGNWKCKFDVDCLKRDFYQGYDCTGYTNLHNVIACPDGSKCKYETTKESISGIPALGKCIPLDAATACTHRPENGPCYGYFKVWYYDSTSKRCKPFIYGGCDGNDNRFQTEASCNKVCENVTTPDIPTIPVAPKVPVVPKAPDVPDVTVAPNVPTAPDVPDVTVAPDVPTTPDIPKVPDVPEIEKNVSNKRSNITHVANLQVVVKPQVKECKIDGERYKIGERFVNKDCTGYCTCISSQGHSCVSLCPPHGIICPIGTKKVTYDKPVLGATRCTCPAYKCVPKDGCFYKGKHYKVLSNFVSQDCTEKCVCQEDGTPFCMPLCSTVAGFARQGPCPVHQKMAQMNFTLPGEPRCSCPIPICYNDNEICSMESDPGPCFGYMKRWFFNKKSGKCEEFYYGGCMGNDNRFFSKKQCMSQCLSQGKITEPTFKIIDNKKDDVRLKPEFGTEDIKIYGRIVFGKFPGKLPSPSCLQVTLEDVSLQDDSSVLYKREKFNVSELNMNKHFLYSITSKKPKNAHEFYSVSAVLNIGWCSNMASKSWIRDLDYLSDTAVYVPFQEGKTLYEIDVPVAFYCRGTACEKKSGPKFVDKNSKTPLTGPKEPKLTEKSDLEPPPWVTIEGKETQKMNVSEGKPPPKANLDEGMPPSLEMCIFLGKKYETGTEFISADCKGRCICTGAKEVSCVSLCPAVAVACPPGMVKAGFEAPVANSQCICLREKCVPDEEAFKKPGPEFPEEAFEKPGPVFPDGPAARPIYGSEKMKIRGKVTFVRIPGKLPSPSCLTVSFEDVALQDVSSVLYARDMIDVSNVTMGSEYKFELNTKKPLNLHDSYSVSATLNVGWCPVPDSDSWVRHNDYLTDTTYNIEMKKDVNEYERTMPLKFYCKGLCNSNIKAEKQLPKKSIEPPKVKELEPPKEELKTLELPGPMFPDGSSPDPQYGNGSLKIRGKLSFERNPGKLPFPSCLSISLQDVSLQDVAATVYKEDLIDVSDVSIASEYNFELVSKKPLMAHGGFSVSATLNVGWCGSPDSRQWIKPGDYLTDTAYYIDIKDELDEYKTVMKMKLYAEKKKGTQPQLPKVKVPHMDSVIEQDVLKNIEDIGEKEKDSESGFGYVKYPVYGDGNITIEGKVNFSSVPGKMPSPSCLTIDFRDISFQDVASILYEEEEYDVSGSEIGKVFKYKMETRRPKSSPRKFSVSAVLNIGWCPDKDSKFWIRNMDFLSVSTVNVPLDDDQTRYEVDIPAVFYCRGKNCQNTKSTNGSDVKPEPQVKIAGALKSVEKTAKKDQSISGKTHKDAKVHVLSPEGAFEIGNKEPKKLPKMPVCKDYASGKEHYPGDEWWGDDDCMHCTCSSEGGTACATPMCALPFCQTGPAIKVKGRCCPVCPEDVLCKENGRTKIAVKERWQRDDCTVCQCTKGGVVCVDSGLKKQSCKRPVRWNGKCEPICADDIMPLIPPPSPKGCVKQDGSFASFLSTWKVDNCTSCSCTKSHGVKCSSPVCQFDNYNCDELEKVKEECCPKCIRKKCIYKYGSYSENEIIVKSDRLTVCRCSNGDWVCDGKKEKKTCKDETGLVFQLGEIRKPDCNTCICAEGGNWACTIMSCPTESKSSQEAMP